MKIVASLLFLALAVAVVLGHGIPIKSCPAGEHSVLYCPQMAEPSCDNPTVHELPFGQGGLCDKPQCFCDTPTVRNTKTGKCVKLSDC